MLVLESFRLVMLSSLVPYEDSRYTKSRQVAQESSRLGNGDLGNCHELPLLDIRELVR